MTHDEGKRPVEVIAARMRELRTRHGWSGQRLAEEMTKVGVPWDRSIVANIENGRRASIGIEEVLALAYVLSVAPVHLVVPVDEDEDGVVPYRVIPEGNPTSAGMARKWFRGQTPIGRVEARRYFSEVPNSEWEPPAGWSPDKIESQSRAVRRDDEPESDER